MPLNKTISWYDNNAKSYFEKTFNSDNHLNQNLFWEVLNSDSPYILDLGCGSGRDALKFQSFGAKVKGIDASKELVSLVNALGINADIMDMREISFNKEFDGIWACASLLHLSKNDCKIVLNKCHDALKVNGIIYVSVKSFEENTNDCRYFSYYERNELESMIKSAGFDIMHCWEASDQLGRTTKWLNVIARKEFT